MAEQVLTVSCKLNPTQVQAEEIEDTLKAFADARSWINKSVDPMLKNSVVIHHRSYKEIRERFGLSANLAVRAINRVAGNRKTAIKNHSEVKDFKPTSIDYDARIFAFREKDETVSLTLLRSRQRIKLVLGDRHRDQLRCFKPTLSKKKSEYYINIQVKSEAPEPVKADKILGVDLGITDIAVTSEGQKFGGDKIKRVKTHYASMRAALQTKAVKGTRSSRRRCRALQKRLSGKEARYQRQINHEISKAIVTRAKEIPAKIALEDLIGIRESLSWKVGKNQRRRVNGWAFYQLNEFLTYKALQAGIPLVLVDPAYTSRTCHIRGEHGDRNGKSFQCHVCSWSEDADFNGAKNIAFLGRYVDRPGGSKGLPSIKAVLSGLLKAPVLEPKQFTSLRNIDILTARTSFWRVSDQRGDLDREVPA
jgi:putative transposase